MIIVADSGSTKTDWVIIDRKNIESEFQTEGLNPVHLSSETILQTLANGRLLKDASEKAKKIYFFGAGCGNEEGKERMEHTLETFFPSAKIQVENDLMAAAIATCGKKKGVVAILGTGSNCCLFDGKKIHTKNFGLGYILGDEGSGAYFGKNLLRAYLYEHLPKELSSSFYEKYDLNRESIIEAVYRKPNPNLFLSSFMPFIIANKNHNWIKDFLHRGINEFFSSNLFTLMHSKKLHVHFVGSVAAELEDLIREKGSSKKLTIGKVIKSPKEGLTEYFLNK